MLALDYMGGRPARSLWTWLWFILAIVFLILAVSHWFGGDDPMTPTVQFIDREVIKTVPIEAIRTEVRTDTVFDIRVVKDKTDRHFYEKAMRQVDSLQKVVRDYAAARGDSIEQIRQGDTVLCWDDGANAVCDTIEYQYLIYGSRLLLNVAPAARHVHVTERTITVETKVFPWEKKAEWASYGAIVSAVLTYFATREK